MIWLDAGAGHDFQPDSRQAARRRHRHGRRHHQRSSRPNRNPVQNILINGRETSDLLLDCDHNPDCLANRVIPALRFCREDGERNDERYGEWKAGIRPQSRDSPSGITTSLSAPVPNKWQPEGTPWNACRRVRAISVYSVVPSGGLGIAVNLSACVADIHMAPSYSREQEATLGARRTKTS